jgi:hypothetical protein
MDGALSVDLGRPSQASSSARQPMRLTRTRAEAGPRRRSSRLRRNRAPPGAPPPPRSPPPPTQHSLQIALARATATNAACPAVECWIQPRSRRSTSCVLAQIIPVAQHPARAPLPLGPWSPGREQSVGGICGRRKADIHALCLAAGAMVRFGAGDDRTVKKRVARVQRPLQRSRGIRKE